MIAQQQRTNGSSWCNPSHDTKLITCSFYSLNGSEGDCSTVTRQNLVWMLKCPQNEFMQEEWGSAPEMDYRLPQSPDMQQMQANSGNYDPNYTQSSDYYFESNSSDDELEDHFRNTHSPSEMSPTKQTQLRARMHSLPDYTTQHPYSRDVVLTDDEADDESDDGGAMSNDAWRVAPHSLSICGDYGSQGCDENVYVDEQGHTVNRRRPDSVSAPQSTHLETYPFAFANGRCSPAVTNVAASVLENANGDANQNERTPTGILHLRVQPFASDSSLNLSPMRIKPITNQSLWAGNHNGPGMSTQQLYQNYATQKQGFVVRPSTPIANITDAPQPQAGGNGVPPQKRRKRLRNNFEKRILRSPPPFITYRLTASLNASSASLMSSSEENITQALCAEDQKTMRPSKFLRRAKTKLLADTYFNTENNTNQTPGENSILKKVMPGQNKSKKSVRWATDLREVRYFQSENAATDFQRGMSHVPSPLAEENACDQEVLLFPWNQEDGAYQNYINYVR